MGHNYTINKLNNLVDTLKLQFYPFENISHKELEDFNNKVDDLIDIKQDAMLIKNHDSQKRFLNTTILDSTYRVMAQAQASFNVVLQNGDISISLLKFNANSSNPLIKVEFRSEFLLRNGHKKSIEIVKEQVNSFLTDYVVRVSELHLCVDIQGYEFTEFDFHRIGTFAKRKAIHNADTMDRHYFGSKFTGFSIGKGDEMMRIYNKTVEIQQNRKKGFIEVLSWANNPSFDENKTVWRIEFQIRRAKLKTLVGNNGLLDTLEWVITALNDIWNYFIKRYVHKNFSNEQVIEKIQGFKIQKDGAIKVLGYETMRKRFQRAEVSYVWDAISEFEFKSYVEIEKFNEITKPFKYIICISSRSTRNWYKKF